MVQFKEGHKWSSEMKTTLIKDMITFGIDNNMAECLRKVKSKHNWEARTDAIYAMYSLILKKEKDAVEALMAELKSNNVAFINPYSMERVNVTAVVSEEISTGVSEDNNTIASISSILKDLDRCNGNSIAWLKGLADMIHRAAEYDNIATKQDELVVENNSALESVKTQVKEYQELSEMYAKENEDLKKQIVALKEDIESINFMLETYLNMDMATRILNINKVPQDIKIVVDKSLNVIELKK